MKPVVFLDFDNTLAYSRYGNTASVRHELERDLATKKRFYQKFKTRRLEEEIADLERQLAEFDKDQQEIAFLDGAEKMVLRGRPGLDRFLRQVGAFADLYILSNGTDAYLDKALDTLGIKSLFKQVISNRTGRKPAGIPDAWVLVDDLPYGSMGIMDKLQLLGDTSEERHIQIQDWRGAKNDNHLAGIVSKIKERLNSMKLKRGASAQRVVARFIDRGIK